MPNNSGVFSLSTYYNKDLSGDIPEKTRESYREYGYFGGGYSGFRSTVDRIDYSNDTSTASVRGRLSLARAFLAATGNSNFGYFGGGLVPATVSTVERINYSNDTPTASVRGPLSSARNQLAATGNSNFGYFFSGAPLTTIIDRIDYLNDLATASIRGSLVSSGYRSSATGNSNFGYFANGSQPGTTTTIQRITYNNDFSTSIIRGSLTTKRASVAATGNSNFGYFGGGTDFSPGPIYSIVNRINYSNDTGTTSLRGPLSVQRQWLTATGNSNFGYFSGGGGELSGFQLIPTSTVHRIDYSNDTVTASVRGPLSIDRYAFAATSSSSFGGSPISQYGVFAKPFGYFGGGDQPMTSRVDRIDYSNDTGSVSVRGPLSSVRGFLAATGNSNFGYFGGGLNPAATPTTVSTVDRIDYSNDSSTASPRGPLSSVKNRSAATGNSNFGYFGSASTLQPGGGGISTVDRINYSNDSAIASVRGPLTENSNQGATGNSNFGYFGGGQGPVSTVDRIDYSSDLSTASVRGPLSLARYGLRATGNSNFGYFVGGFLYPTPIYSTVDRIDYSNDTATSSVRGPLSSSRYGVGATGNSNFGYFGGGSNAATSTVDRIDYSNDTATASIRGPLSLSRNELGASSPTAFGGATDFQSTQQFFDIQSMRRIEDTTNYSVKKRALGSYGYFGGGYAPGVRSTVDRIDYSNDTSTASVRGPLSIQRYFFYAVGNNNFGYFGGGYFSPGQIANIDRIDYSNDSSTASFRNNLSTGRLAHAGTSNNNFGYFGGGYVPGTQTNIVERINFSNDLSALLTRGPLSLARKYLASTGNDNFGYYGGGGIGGGGSQPATTTIDRINYSNDLSTASLRNFLSTTRRNLSASGNQNFGYFSGGIIGAGGGSVSTIERINYASDLSSVSIRGPLSSARSYICATGNQNFGFISGGSSIVDRIDHSNDSATASIRGPLSLARTAPAASTNARSS